MGLTIGGARTAESIRRRRQDGRIDSQRRPEEIDHNIDNRADVVTFGDDAGRQAREPVLDRVVQLAEREHVLVIDTDERDVLTPGPPGAERLEIRYHQLRLERLEVLGEKLVVLPVRLGQFHEVALERFGFVYSLALECERQPEYLLDPLAEVLLEVQQRLLRADEHHVVPGIQESLAYQMGPAAVSESLARDCVDYSCHFFTGTKIAPRSWETIYSLRPSDCQNSVTGFFVLVISDITAYYSTPRYVKVLSIILAAAGDETIPPV
jgi:hypothetical protein